MGHFIVKLDGCYMEWSTIVDAPISYLMPLPAFEKYYARRYGAEGLGGLAKRIARADQNGTSLLDSSDDLESICEWNRAGENETSLTREELIAIYRIDDFEIAGAEQ